MIDFLIFILQTFYYKIFILGIGSTIVMLLIVVDDISLRENLSSIKISFPRRRVGRHRRTIKITVLKRCDDVTAWVRDLSELLKDIHDEKAAWRKEKEESARGKGFFDAFYAPSFNADGSPIHPNGIKFPTELSKAYYRKLDELADVKIFENTEVL